jgi:RNA polymerase sigma factor (sigma-70 family)
VTREEILQLLRERIKRFLLSRFGRSYPPDVIEDLVQAAMLVLTEKYDAITALEDLVKLGIRIAQLIALDLSGRAQTGAERKKVSLKDWDLRSPALNPEEAAAAREQIEQLHAAIKRLKPKCRIIFELQLSEVPDEKIRAALGFATPAALHRNRSRCLARLRRLMGEPKEEARL